MADSVLFCPQALPVTQHPEVFGMHENVDISRELQDVRNLFDSVLLTQGGSGGGGGGKTDETLQNIATDVLSKVTYLCTKCACQTEEEKKHG